MSASSLTRTKDRRRSRFARLLPKLILLSLALVFSLTTAELITRWASGYRLFATSLERTSPPRAAIDEAFDEHAELIEGFLQDNTRPGLEPAWIRETPAPVKTRKVDAGLREREQQYGMREFTYHLNEAWLRSLWVKGKGVDLLAGAKGPPDFQVFASVEGSVHPFYRFPPSMTLPSGLTTNAFGFRGRDVALNKPARTVRIACVGASTTVCQHFFRHSYPELLEHWLNLWSKAKGLDLNFEVLNAGREAIRSRDLRAIVEQEVLPLSVDYVVYYEGANQFHLLDIAKHIKATEVVKSLVPPDELDIPYPGIAPEESWLDKTARSWALAERARSVLQGSTLWAEPTKPAQHLELPAGLDPAAPSFESALEFAQMATIFEDLEGIEMATDAAGARLVLCSFAWLVHEGLALHPVRDRNIFALLNRAYWPIRYGILRQLVDLENRCFELWAERHSVDFIDVAAGTPADVALFTDQYHGTELGLRVRAWLVLVGLIPLIEADLQTGRIPVKANAQLQSHPGIGKVRTITARELDGK